LTLKVVSRVTWATSVPILVFLGLSVLNLGPMYATDVRQMSDVHHRIIAYDNNLGVPRTQLGSLSFYVPTPKGRRH